MYRNSMNRFWIITLACVLGLGLLASVPATCLAVATAPSVGGDPGPLPNVSGDPDSPSNTGRPTAVVSRGSTRGATHQTPASPGEAWTARNGWVIKIRIALQMVRVFHLHD